MAITTYAELQTGVLNWLNRSGDTDATTRAPEWISLAEDEIKVALGASPLRQGETKDAAFSVSAEYVALPSGFLRARNFIIQGSPNVELDFTAPNVADRNANPVNGKPKKYTIQGNQLRFIPPPDATYTGTFSYQALPVLSVSNTTNWLLTAHPKIYLYAALAEAAAYYQDVAGYTGYSTVWNNLFSASFTADGPSAAGSVMRMQTDMGHP